jgi:lipid II:glycine glycyltransferase (peptidoglycan interpeptide bridge formation enzyme)
LFTHLSIHEWQQLVDGRTQASIFHHRNWLELISNHYGFGIRIPAIKQNGEIRAALPFLEVRNLWNRRKLISLPFTDCIRVLASDDRASHELADALRSDKRYQTAEIRTDKPLRATASSGPWVRSQLSLTANSDGASRQYCSNVERNVRKAKKNKLHFEPRTDPDAMDEFFRLHVLTRRRLGVPVQTRGFFQAVYRRIIAANLGYVGLVVQTGEVIAAGVFMCMNGTMVYKYGASHPQTTQFRPNELLIHGSIQVADEQECTNYDFGVSSKHQEGLRRFKRKWGAVETDVVRESVVGRAISESGESRALDVASLVIRNSPVVVCRALGAMLYRYSQ